MAAYQVKGQLKSRPSGTRVVTTTLYKQLTGIKGRPQSVRKEKLAFIQNPGNEINLIFFWEFEVMGPRCKIIYNS